MIHWSALKPSVNRLKPTKRIRKRYLEATVTNVLHFMT